MEVYGHRISTISTENTCCTIPCQYGVANGHVESESLLQTIPKGLLPIRASCSEVMKLMCKTLSTPITSRRLAKNTSSGEVSVASTPLNSPPTVFLFKKMQKRQE